MNGPVRTFRAGLFEEQAHMPLDRAYHTALAVTRSLTDRWHRQIDDCADLPGIVDDLIALPLLQVVERHGAAKVQTVVHLLARLDLSARGERATRRLLVDEGVIGDDDE